MPRSRRIKPPQNLAKLPEVYSAICDGTCLSPAIPDGSLVIFNSKEPPRPGDYVFLWLLPEFNAPGQAGLVKRLRSPIPQYVTFPCQMPEGSEIMPCLMVEQINPARTFSVACDHLRAVHKAVGYVPPGALEAYRSGKCRPQPLPIAVAGAAA